MTARRLSALAATLILLAAAVLPAAARAEAIKLKFARVPLSGFDLERQSVGKLNYRGGLELVSPHAQFGGFSGLLVAPGGASLLAVSDRGHWLRAGLVLTDGKLTGISRAEMGAIRGHKGAVLTGTRRDAESLARGTDGRNYIAFERRHRIVRYIFADTDFRKGRVTGRPPGAERSPRNAGIEALTELPGGRLLAITEDNRLRPATLRGWIGSARGTRWQALTYAKTATYQPTGAATLPNGDVLVLERSYRPPFSLAVRIVRIPSAQIRPGGRLSGSTVALIDARMTIDNFEGIATARGPKGETLVFLISDDNFNAIQRTYLLMFELMD